jgi:hypothetical protein
MVLESPEQTLTRLRQLRNEALDDELGRRADTILDEFVTHFVALDTAMGNGETPPKDWNKITQLSEEDADRIGKATYYSSRDCADGMGGVIGWDTLAPDQRKYWTGVANVALSTDASIRHTTIVERRDLNA